MAVNRGKQFEEQIRKAFEKIPNTTVTRLIDPQNGYAGVRNICDFIIYHYPYQYFIECKSCHGNTFPFSNVTQNQWDGMLEMSKTDGVIAGVIVWFIDHDSTYFLSIELLNKLKECGCKSVHYYPDWVAEVPDCDNLWNHIVGKKKQILFDYDLTDFIRRLDLWDR